MATIRPPRSPPSGPKSTTQSEQAITSKLCSTNMTVCPCTASVSNAETSFATSSRCRPVVGSSNMNNVFSSFLFLSLARYDANLSLCASPPDKVGTGCPRRIYSNPTSHSGFNLSTIRCSSRKYETASDTVIFKISDIFFLPSPSRLMPTAKTASLKRFPSQAGHFK